MPCNSDSKYEGDERQPHVSMEKVDAHSPPETCQLMTQSGIAKAKLPWADLIVKSFFGGVFISLGSLFDLVVTGGAPGLRKSNPSLITFWPPSHSPSGVLAWWSDTLNSEAMSSYAVTQAEQRVNINWWFNFTRGIGCNWLVGLAVYLATSSKDNLSKIVGIWIPIWAL
ncbi:hypothetical protein FVER53590_28400 [Fusarium verticillioides]|nr:hypothetical protein FVER53590_28400 [Fusarium verticillioides]